MKIINERERQTTKIVRRDGRKKERKEERGGASYTKSVRAKWFCCAFNLGFLQLMCQASLIFKSNLELALSITLKEKQNCVSQSILWWSVNV